MMFKAAIAVIVALALAAGGLYWRNDVLSRNLQAAQIRADNAVADAALTHAAIKAVTAYSARTAQQAAEQTAIEDTINRTEGADAPISPEALAFLRSIGLLAD